MQLINLLNKSKHIKIIKHKMWLSSNFYKDLFICLFRAVQGMVETEWEKLVCQLVHASDASSDQSFRPGQTH